MKAADIIAQVEELRELHRTKGVNPVYEIDARAYKHNWIREVSDLIFWGVKYGMNTKGFQDGIKKYQ